MPIHGLTTGNEFLPVIGTLRKGAEQGTNRPGQDLDYFRFTAPDEPELETKFAEIFGPEPRTIPFLFPYEFPEQNMEAWNFQFEASGLVVKCDGRNKVSEYIDGQMIHYSTGEAPACQHGTTACQCKPRGIMFIIIPALERLAAVKVLTGSVNDIRTLDQSLKYFARLCEQRNILLTELPMQLIRHKEKRSTPMGGKRGQTVKSLLRIEPLPAWITASLKARTPQGTPISMRHSRQDLQRALPSGNPQDEEQGAIEAELMNPPRSTAAKLAADVNVNSGTATVVDQSPTAKIASDVGTGVKINPSPTEKEKAFMTLKDKFSENGFTGPNEARQITITALILNTSMRDRTIESLTLKELNAVIAGMQSLSKNLKNVEDILAFTDQTLDGFKMGVLTNKGWDFEQYLSDWAQSKYSDEEIFQDDLPF